VTNDDRVLACCLFYVALGARVVLLSNDHTLGVKALVHGVPCYAWRTMPADLLRADSAPAPASVSASVSTDRAVAAATAYLTQAAAAAAAAAAAEGPSPTETLTAPSDLQAPRLPAPPRAGVVSLSAPPTTPVGAAWTALQDTLVRWVAPALEALLRHELADV
jgi:hypothetical protein